MKKLSLVPLLVLLSATIAHAQPLVTVQTVGVSDVGNRANSEGLGSVSGAYQIGKYEVTINQYAAFLNAIARTNTNAFIVNLWNTNMASDLNIAGIGRSGVGTPANPYTYSVITNSGSSADRPISYVSWFDAARFCNWLHNGATNGASTETGAYSLAGATNGIISKNPGAKWWIPSEDEWIKAAYYKGGSTNAGYWQYPTRSDTVPGNAIGSASNNANYMTNGRYSVTQSTNLVPTQNYLTSVGSFTGTTSPYGTMDQAGNVWEWTDAVVNSTNRAFRGGCWGDNDPIYLLSSIRGFLEPTSESPQIGFRVVGEGDSDGDGLTDNWELGYGRYEIVNGAFLTWEAAKADAEARGGQLVTITSSTEQANMIAILGGAANLNGWAYWIGAKFTSGAWGWINGETWSYTDWRGGNGGGGPEPYGVLFGTAQNTGYEDLILHWGDLSDFYQAFYILERGFPTDPYNPDTDGDGLSDKVETGSGTFVNAQATGTNPLKSDSNGDGFSDGETFSRGINPLTDQSQVLQMVKELSLASPGRFNLYGVASIMDMNLGGLLLQKNGNSATVVFQPQTTTDLATQPFTNNGTPVTNQILMPGTKGFIRIRANPTP